MKNRRLGTFAIVMLAMLGFIPSVHSQDSKSLTRYYDGQIIKIDAKNKTITIKGPQGLVPGDSPQGRGGGRGRGRGGGGNAGASGSGGIDVRRFEYIETKITATVQTEVQSDGAELKFDDLKIDDYVFVTATKDGKKIQAIIIKRSTRAKDAVSAVPPVE